MINKSTVKEYYFSKRINKLYVALFLFSSIFSLYNK